MRNVEDILSSMRELPSFSEIQSIDVNSVGCFGETPLHIAAIQGDLEAIKVLVFAGSCLNSIGEHGYTPLHEAVEQRNLSVVEMLLGMGADATIRNDNDLTPRELAILLDFQEIVKLFDSS